MRYSIHPDAEAELDEAADYYATHASKMIDLRASNVLPGNRDGVGA